MRLYLQPKIGAGTHLDPFRAAYVFPDTIRVGLAPLSRCMDYGKHNVFLVEYLPDLSGADHATLIGLPGVVAFPLNLNATIGASLATVQAAFDNAEMPHDGLTTAHTFLDAARRAVRMIHLAQKIDGMVQTRLFPNGLTLDSLLSDLTANQRTRMNNAAQALGLDTSNLTLGMSIRAALRSLADQFSVTAYGGATV